MTHERLTPNGGIPLNRNMEGSKDPEVKSGPKVTFPESPQAQVKETALREAWYKGRDPLTIPADERQTIEELIRMRRLPVEGAAPEDEVVSRAGQEAALMAELLQHNVDPEIAARMAATAVATRGESQEGEDRGSRERQAGRGQRRNIEEDHERPLTHEEIVRKINEHADSGRPKTAREALSKSLESVEQADSIDRFRQGAKTVIFQHVSAFPTAIVPGNERTTYAEKFKEIVAMEDLGQAKRELRELVLSLSDRYETVPEADREEVPKSFDEFIDLIIDKETDDYKPGGLFELRSKAKEGEVKGEIRYENFSAWAWNKAMWWDQFSPDDTKLSFFSSASINLNYRTVSLQEFITDKRYERGSITKPVLDQDGKPKLDRRTGEEMYTTLYHNNTDHKKMVEKMVDEMWFYNQTRNFGVAYRLAKEQDKDLNEAYGGILSSDIFTRSNGFEVLYSMAGVSGEKYLDDNNTIAGTLAAIGESVYDKIYDFDKLQKLLGRNSTFFRRDFLKASDGQLKLSDQVVSNTRGGLRLHGDVETGEKKGRGSTTVRGAGTIKWNEKWYDEDGVLNTRTDGKLHLDWRRGQFLDYINIFNEQNKSPGIIDEARERIRQSMVERVLESNPSLLTPGSYLYKKYDSIFRGNEERYREFTDNTEKNRRIEIDVKKAIIQAIYLDATRAEAIAYSNTFWFGIAGMNDTTATGFDVGTKWWQTAAYRSGQSRPTTVGTDLGNPRTIGIYKRLMAPFKDAIRIRGSASGENRKTLQGVINEIADNAFKTQTATEVVDGKEVQVKVNKSRESAKQLKFNSTAMRTYYGNHIARGGPVYEELATGQDFDPSEYLKWDFHQGWTTDTVKFTKDLKDRIKRRRYLISGYSDTDYTEKVHTYRQRGLSKKEQEELRKELAREQGIDEKDVKLPSFRVITGSDKELGLEMFGKQVYKRNFTHKEGKNKGKIDWGKVESNRGEMWREAWFIELAAGLKAHRDRMDMSNPIGYMQIEGFFEILKKIPANLYYDPDLDDDPMRLRYTDPENKYAFTDEMINYIRKLSGTTTTRLVLTESGREAGVGFLKGFAEAIKILLGSLK